MGKSIKSVEFIFENCESLVFDYPDIFMFNIWGEKDYYSSYCNVITLDKSIAGFYVGLSATAQPSIENSYFVTQGDNAPNISRLDQYKDVTQILVTFTDNSNKHYLVEWPEDDSTTHSGQTLTKTENGHILYLSKMPGDKQEIPALEDVDSLAFMALKL